MIYYLRNLVKIKILPLRLPLSTKTRAKLRGSNQLTLYCLELGLNLYRNTTVNCSGGDTSKSGDRGFIADTVFQFNSSSN